ncbi:unnamed protein product [Symbiodinium natans]|uniref:Uncharacterized protein n=1 Tax=Symbiodinium natans TaxID=878477 RepID=A0A812QJI0_9DINO|nr:unnamed protein product [Symbiodinium natans]
MAASSGEAFVDRAARDAAAGTASNEKLPRASCRQAHQAVQTERQEDTEHHGRYTRLDAELAHFHAELSSCNSVWDSVVFFACGALGYLVDSLLYAISGPSSRDRNGWDGFQYAWILMSFTGLLRDMWNSFF